ncbi:membrane protein of unknown function [Streptococcus thermophilus]|uniref:Biotin transporter BioY n=1 Tax=Streptococcus thermophilus TaxID=1308 RepID=A0A8D6U8T5_STRTR|nr:membrane protein of unknown function [Streptococcus thermophilus]
MNKIDSITFIALGATLIIALSPFQITLGPIPITLQILVIGLIATLYRPKEATLSVLLYILLGQLVCQFSLVEMVVFTPLLD